jgi:hypothetical protein
MEVAGKSTLVRSIGREPVLEAGGLAQQFMFLE